MNKYIEEIENSNNLRNARVAAAQKKFTDIQRESWDERQKNRLNMKNSKPYEKFDLSDSKTAPFRLTFIIGTNRTGSTLLNGMLAGGHKSYPGLPDMHPLSDLMTCYYKLLFRYDDDHFNHYGSIERISSIFKCAMHDTIMSSFFNAGFKIKEKEHLILKSANDFSLYIDRLPDIFGDNFKLVYLIRDPRDVISSNQKYREKTGKGDLITELIPNIKKYYDTIHKTNMFKDKEKLFVLRYEDLVSQNEEIIRNLENFLEYDVSRTGFQEMGYSFNEKLHQYSEGWGGALHNKSVAKYKKNLNKDEIEAIEYFFDKYMKMYNYL